MESGSLSLQDLTIINQQQRDLDLLREQVDLLTWEKEIIKQRVYIKVRDLVLENEELKRRVADLEAALTARKKTLSSSDLQDDANNKAPRKDSNEILLKNSNESGKRLSLQTSYSSNSGPVINNAYRKNSSDKETSPHNSSRGSTMDGEDGNAGNSPPQLTPRDSPGGQRNDKDKRQGSSWKDKVKTSFRKQTTKLGLTSSTSKDDEDDIFSDENEDAPKEDIASSKDEPSLQEELFEDDANDLLFVRTEGSNNKLPIVKAGTEERLIERLVPEKYPDTDYLSHFLLTYRSFTSPERIWELLMAKFNMTAPPDADPEDFAKNRLAHVRLRVINVLKTWSGRKHSYDLEDSVMKEKIEQFIPLLETSGFVRHSELLKNSFEKLRLQQHYFVPSTQPPKPNLGLVPLGTPSEIVVTDIDPLEMARQITLIEYDLFKVICPNECLGQSWNKAGKEIKSPHVLSMIHWTNHLSGWVFTETIKRDNPKARADLIKYFIRVAKHCKDLNNFNAIFEILAALQNSAIDRLKKSWEKLEKVTKAMHQELAQITSREKNFQVHRDLLKKALPPCIPYLGMFLTDLTFIDTGLPDRIKSPHFEDGLINFDKLRKTATVIKQIQEKQQTGYSLEVVPQIREYLMTAKERNITEEEAYRLSLQLEPREPASS